MPTIEMTIRVKLRITERIQQQGCIGHVLSRRPRRQTSRKKAAPIMLSLVVMPVYEREPFAWDASMGIN